ncbi:hypothetical protein T07_2183 [Trichinella nelsoni]|uniref:Uncharacterized protein n=1 Tax=Trichinella nelsoni TaxID=6336 RepID=A0A0V0RGI2_9BILA|nr:hypothetical protein T07_2183 [Trichinella nelsoni]
MINTQDYTLPFAMFLMYMNAQKKGLMKSSKRHPDLALTLLNVESKLEELEAEKLLKRSQQSNISDYFTADECCSWKSVHVEQIFLHEGCSTCTSFTSGELQK